MAVLGLAELPTSTLALLTSSPSRPTSPRASVPFLFQLFFHSRELCYGWRSSWFLSPANSFLAPSHPTQPRHLPPCTHSACPRPSPTACISFPLLPGRTHHHLNLHFLVGTSTFPPQPLQHQIPSSRSPAPARFPWEPLVYINDHKKQGSSFPFLTSASFT